MSHDVLDKEGKSIGNLETFFADREYREARMARRLRRHVPPAPLPGAGRGGESEGSAVRVPWTKEQVRGAPEYGDPEGSISEEMERDAYRHYGIEAAVS